MADNRTMAQMLQAPIEGYEDAIVVPLINANNFELKQTLINLVQNALDSAASGNFLDKMPRDGLAIIESKSKVRYSRNLVVSIKPRASTNELILLLLTPTNSFEFQQLARFYEDKKDIESRLEKRFMKRMLRLPATGFKADVPAIIMNKVPEKLEDPGKFLIPCALQELDRTSALADSEASINLLPQSIYKQALVLKAFDDPNSYDTRLSNSICYPSNGYQAEMFVVRVDGKFTNEFTLPNSLPPGDDVSIHKKDIHEETFSNPLFEFDDNFKSSNVNPLFEEKDKDVEIKSSPSFTLTSPEESELEAYLERDSIPPGIDLNLPPTLEVSSSNPTSPTLTGEKVCSWKTPMFFSLIRFVWRMMTRIAIRKKIICLLATFLNKKPKPLSRPQEVDDIKMKDDKDLKMDFPVAFDSTESSILPPPLLDSDSPFTAEFSASVTLNSLGNEDKVFKPGILVYHTIHDKNLATLEKN
ncbi:hypothetical protein Tco_0039199 [Tanacetum coccineum]